MTGGNLSCVKASDDLMTVMKFFALRENPISVFFYTAVGGSLKKMYQGFFFQSPLYKNGKKKPKCLLQEQGISKKST